MAAPAQLTTGAVAKISENADSSATLKPVLQVVDLRMVTKAKNPVGERYRMMLSDGVDMLQSMLSTSENALVRDGVIRKGSILHLLEYTCSTIQGRRITIIIKLDVLQSECELIGSAKLYVPKNLPPEGQGPNLPANAPQINTRSYSGDPSMLESSVAPMEVQAASNAPYGGSSSHYQGTAGPTIGQPAEPVPSGPGMLGSNVAPTEVQVAGNTVYGGAYSGYQGTAIPPIGRPAEPVPSDPGMLGSSGPPMAVQVASNASYGGSYSGYQGTTGPPMGRAAEPVPNMSSGGSYGTMPAHNTMNSNVMQPKLQQTSLNSHPNQRFAVPAATGRIGTPGNTYGHPAQPSYQQPPSAYMNRGVSRDEGIRITPVCQLNPYQAGWTIKARVTTKSDMRHYNNAKGPGKVFSFDVLDAQGGEIRVTCFNLQADQYFDLIEVDKVYLISKGTLKPAQKKFNPLNHEYEIVSDHRTAIEICSGDDCSIPRQQYNFQPISVIENVEIGASVDLVGIVTSVGSSVTIMRKDGKETQKKTLQLRDMSGRSVEITLWGKLCDAEGQQLQLECDSGRNPVLALKNGRVTDFNGRSIGSISSTQLKVNPDFPEAERLQQWYATEGKTAPCVSLSRLMSSMGSTDVRKTVAQIKDENLGLSEKPDFVTIKGAISYFNADNFCYPACTLEADGKRCNKKVVNNGDGTWHCDKCDQGLPNCEYRYILNCQIQDHTGVTYCDAFEEGGTQIIGYSAHELYDIKEQDTDQFAEILQGVRWQQFLFKLRVYENSYNDEKRVKCTILKAEKLDPSKESLYLLGVIDSVLKNDTGLPPEMQGGMSYNVSRSNSGVAQSLPTSNSAYTTNISGAGQQANMYSRASNPTCMSCGSSGHNAQNCPAGMYRQQPAASVASSYGSSPGNAGLGGASGGYNRQPYVGGY